MFLARCSFAVLPLLRFTRVRIGSRTTVYLFISRLLIVLASFLHTIPDFRDFIPFQI